MLRGLVIHLMVQVMPLINNFLPQILLLTTSCDVADLDVGSDLSRVESAVLGWTLLGFAILIGLLPRAGHDPPLILLVKAAHLCLLDEIGRVLRGLDEFLLVAFIDACDNLIAFPCSICSACELLLI